MRLFVYTEQKLVNATSNFWNLLFLQYLTLIKFKKEVMHKNSAQLMFVYYSRDSFYHYRGCFDQVAYLEIVRIGDVKISRLIC